MTRWLVAITMTMMFSLSPVVFALDIYQLEKEKQIEISSWLDIDSKQQKTAVINQQVIMYIEVATPRWFTGGTDIKPFSIDNLVIPPRNMLATNFTENIQGVTWSRQRWEVRLFPQISGKYVIPPIAVQVQISAEHNDGKTENVRGVLFTQPLAFSAQNPSGFIDREKGWVTATKVALSQQWLQSSEETKAGDSVTRIITINASNTLAMLIPDLLKTQTDYNLYHSYPDPPQLKDSQVRGDYQSRRIEQEVYLLQSGGDVVFPELNLQWWNSDSGKLEQLTLEGKTIKVKHTLSSLLRTYWRLIALATGLVLLLILVLFRTKVYYKTHPLPDTIIFNRALRDKAWPKARTLIYKKLYKENNQLQLGTYSDDKPWLENSVLVQSSSTTRLSLNIVWKTLKRNRTLFRLTLPKALPKLEKVKTDSAQQHAVQPPCKAP